MIELKNIDHFCILVGKLDISKRYYMQIFSGVFKIHPKDSKTLMFESEMVHFFLKEVDLPQNFLSYQHFSFEVKDITKIIHILEDKKINFEYGTFNSFKYKNYKWVEWRDPDGIHLECVELLT